MCWILLALVAINVWFVGIVNNLKYTVFHKTNNHLQDPQPLPYLQHTDKYNFDINLEVALKGN